MFTASYPASFLPEENGKGFHVRFPDLAEALTGGDDIGDTFVQAADCLAEAIAGRFARGNEIPPPSKRFIDNSSAAPGTALVARPRRNHGPDSST